MSIQIKNFNLKDLEKAKKFTDQWIGENYYALDELEEILEKSQLNGESASFIAEDKGEIVGIRFSFAPGKWTGSFKKGLSFDLWKIEPDSMGYFKSLFVHGDYQGKGLGKSLSNKSLEVFKKMGAEGALCHSWLESPGNSSQKYLFKMGFEKVKEH
ncbi:MAG: GNAT family N-acetyltransferase, partial [Bdellovibrionota bacterium]|nr:GNAT family N-acetyltransferase [Bdellovibrionota bacterium]